MEARQLPHVSGTSRCVQFRAILNVSGGIAKGSAGAGAKPTPIPIPIGGAATTGGGGVITVVLLITVVLQCQWRVIPFFRIHHVI